MATLIALLSSGKGTWGQVNSLFKANKWDKVYLLCNDFAYDNFEIKDPQKITKLKFDETKINSTFDKLANFFKKEVKDIDVAVNLSSGSGMEHMAVVSAVLKAGLGIRFVYTIHDEIKEFEIMPSGHMEEEDDF